MKFINRPVLVIKPREPYLNWTEQVSPDSMGLRPEDTQQDCTTYLLSEALDRQHLESFLQENYAPMFEHELYAWHRDQRVWPVERNYAVFREWFDVEMHSQVIDMIDPDVIPHSPNIGS